MSRTRIGKFQVLGTLGTGAHSSILHIRRDEDGRQYALKVVPINSKAHEKFLDQARHEFEVAGMLDHPNLIKIHALETSRDFLFRIRKVQALIEYVDGKALDTIPPVPVPKLLPVFVQVADGLVHMHRQGVYHADLKPGNILLAKNGQVKVIDYGLAWIKGQSKDRVQGTPEYMAPETASRKVVNELTDVYNFGAAMYRMLTFRTPPLPFLEDGTPINAASFARQFKPIGEFNANVPRQVREVVHACLSFDPKQRPQRMSEVQGTLDRLADEFAEPAQSNRE